MRLDPNAFDALFHHFGQPVLWRRSYACPCFSADSGAAQPGCPQCAGRGRIWNAPVACEVALSGQKVQKEWAQLGQYESGDTVVSLPTDVPAYAAGQFDRFTLLASTDQFSENLTRDGSERLYGAVVAIERVFWLDGAGAIVEGGIPAVGADGALTWPVGQLAPPAFTQFNIAGTRQNEYFVFNALPANRNLHQGTRFAKKVVLRKFDLFGR